MAEQLGSAVLTLGVETAQFKAGLDASLRDAQRKGDQIQQALNARQTRVDSNQTSVVRLQRELINADAARAAEIRKRISLLQVENREQQAGIAALRQKLAANRQVEASIGAQIQGLRQSAQAAVGQQPPGAAVVGGAISGFGRQLAGAAAGLSVGAFLKSSIQAAAELETITRKLTVTLGPQGAAGALTFTRGVANELGVNFKTLAGTFGSFTAAASAANIPLSTQKELFFAVSRAGQQLGLSTDEINGSFIALQQIASKGTVSMEELRGQLGERLPIALTAAANGLGLTQKQLIKLVESGSLTAAQFFPALIKGLNGLASSSAAAPTAAQNLEKLGNAWDELQTSLGENLLPATTASIIALTNAIKNAGDRQLSRTLGLAGNLGGFGVIPEEGQRAVKAVKELETQFGLTREQAVALFYDAAKLGGLQLGGTGFLSDAKAFEKTLALLPSLAQKWTAEEREAAEQKDRQLKGAQRLLAISDATAEAQKKYLDGPQQALRDAQALQGLQGQALQIAQQQLNIDKLRAVQRKAAADYDKALMGAGFDRDNPAVITAAAKLEAAGLNLKTALIDGSNALIDAAKQAREQLLSATLDRAKQLTSRNEGLNRFLRTDIVNRRQGEGVGLLQTQLREAVRAAGGLEKLNAQSQQRYLAFMGQATKATQVVTGYINGVALTETRQPTAADAEWAQELINAAKSDQDSQQALIAANQAVAAVNQGLSSTGAQLAGLIPGLSEALFNLAGKSWVVNVAVPGGTASGDVVSNVNGGF